MSEGQFVMAGCSCFCSMLVGVRLKKLISRVAESRNFVLYGCYFSLIFSACLLFATRTTRHSSCRFLEVRLLNMCNLSYIVLGFVLTNLYDRIFMLLLHYVMCLLDLCYHQVSLCSKCLGSLKNWFFGCLDDWKKRNRILTNCAMTCETCKTGFSSFLDNCNKNRSFF